MKISNKVTLILLVSLFSEPCLAKPGDEVTGPGDGTRPHLTQAQRAQLMRLQREFPPGITVDQVRARQQRSMDKLNFLMDGMLKKHPEIRKDLAEIQNLKSSKGSEQNTNTPKVRVIDLKSTPEVHYAKNGTPKTRQDYLILRTRKSMSNLFTAYKTFSTETGAEKQKARDQLVRLCGEDCVRRIDNGIYWDSKTTDTMIDYYMKKIIRR